MLLVMRGVPRVVPGAWRVIARRRSEFAAVPLHHARALDSIGRSWEATGPDPAFELVPTEGGLPSSWVLVDFRVEVDGEVSPPLLYVDEGAGYTEGTCLQLPRPANGHLCAIMLLPERGRALRLDPMERPGTFRLGPLRMQKIGRIELGMRTLAPVVGRLLREPRHIPSAMRRAFGRLWAGGLQGIKDQLVGQGAPVDDYTQWVREFDTLDESDRRQILRRIRHMPHRPRLSILMPVYNTDERWLRRAIDSVESQLYPDWELCIADDASTSPYVRHVLEESAARDPRIKPVFRQNNGGISEATNSALAVATGEFVVLLDSDDELPSHALYVMAEEMNAHPGAHLFYSDEDKVDEQGRRFDPFFKPDWSPDFIVSQNYFCHLGVYRTALVRSVGGFRSATEGSQDYDLVLRCASLTEPANIRHVPFILYHWRAIASSGAADPRAKSFAERAAVTALEDHFVRHHARVEVSVGEFPNLYRVRYRLPDPPPLVSVILGFGDGRLLWRCIRTLLERTSYPRLEVIVTSGMTAEEAPREGLNDGRVRMVWHHEAATAGVTSNLAAREGKGTVLVFLSEQLEVADGDWLNELVSHAVRPEIGVVGGRLLYANGTLQDAGIIVGLRGVAGHLHRGLPEDSAGYFGRAKIMHGVSAVTAACLAIRKRVFDEVGGFDEENVPDTFGDLDICLRVRVAGYRNLWTPYAELRYQASSACPPSSDLAGRKAGQEEFDFLRRRWEHMLPHDPYHNPNLSLDHDQPTLAWPPRVRRAWSRA
jgi:GT2 family glycosyltransferase